MYIFKIIFDTLVDVIHWRKKFYSYTSQSGQIQAARSSGMLQKRHSYNGTIAGTTGIAQTPYIYYVPRTQAQHHLHT